MQLFIVIVCLNFEGIKAKTVMFKQVYQQL